MRFLLCAGALLLASLTGPALAQSLTIEQATAPIGAISVSLSPDGKHVAMVYRSDTDYALLLYDTVAGTTGELWSSRYVRENFIGYVKSPLEVEWAGNELLAVDYGLKAESMDLQGNKVSDLGTAVLGHAERDRPESPWMLVYTDREDRDIAKINALTGEQIKLTHPRGKVISWAFDRKGDLRAVSLVNSEFWRDVSTVTNWYRPTADAKWRKLAEFGITEEFWLPVYVPDESDKLVIVSRAGRDTYAMFSYDTQRREIGELKAGHPTQDILGATGVDQAAFERVGTRGMRAEVIWFDPVWKAVQASVDQALPDRVNHLSGNPRGKVLVYSYSDIEPGIWYLMDVAKGTLGPLARRMQSTVKTAMRSMEIMHYAAPDGLTVPAFLTRPADGARNSPLVVLIHGGPAARDYWAWNREVQILAAAGYAVFQPQFRGSTGFGKRFEQAGYGQWGLAMQDDITTGVSRLIEQGIADPKRICIVGASYGGYAALWGLAKTPELYQCGVSFAGVADIEYMLRDGSDSTSDKAARQWMLTSVGDVSAQATRFDDVSPLKHADRIIAPVLLVHGEDDERVPISHGKKMKQALEANGRKVEWLSFKGEGHGLYYLGNERHYYFTLLAFLDKYIGTRLP